MFKVNALAFAALSPDIVVVRMAGATARARSGFTRDEITRAWRLAWTALHRYWDGSFQAGCPRDTNPGACQRACRLPCDPTPARRRSCAW